MKRWMKVWLVVLLLVVASCGQSTPNKKESATNKEFNAFIEKVPKELFDPKDYGLNFVFENKANFGYEDVIYEYTLPTREWFDETLKQSKTIYKELTSFDRDSLDAKQQLTYDVMKEYFNTDTKLSDDASYYLNTDELNESYGAPSNLPINLYLFSFRNETDVKSYLNLLKTAPDYFKALVNHEQDRQDHGFGMTKSHVTSIIKQCTDFIDGNHQFLVDSFNDKLAKVKGISSEAQTQYKQENEEYLKSGLFVAYQNLKQDLEALNVKTKTDTGLASAYGKEGKKQYAELIKEFTGFEDMEEYRTYLEDVYENRMNVLKTADPDVLSKFYEILGGEGEDGITFTNATTPQDVLKELQEAIKADFPKIRDMEYEMEIVPESMQSIFTAAAAYLNSPVDSNTVKERMLLNSEFSQSSFLTIAHEGFPGHMYQKQFYKDLNTPIIRQLMDFDGYVEGYANYVENYSAKYSEEKELAELYVIANQITYAKILLTDLEMHYDGKSENKVLLDLQLAFSTDKEGALGIYHQLLHTPALFSKYYGAGFRLYDLRQEVKDRSKKYTDKEFHSWLLEVGPAPYDIVESYILNKTK